MHFKTTVSPGVPIFKDRISPRASTLLFMFLRPKGLRVVSYVEFTGESKNHTLTKINSDIFSEIELFVPYRVQFLD